MTVPGYSDLTSVGIVFDTTGVTVVSGETVFDISSGVLTVTAADGSEQDYGLSVMWRSGL